MKHDKPHYSIIVLHASCSQNMNFLEAVQGTTVAQSSKHQSLIHDPNYSIIISTPSFQHTLPFRAKFGHENEVLRAKKSLAAGGNGLTFGARSLLDF